MIMNMLATLIRETIPNYLKNLPVPDSFAGIFQLGSKSSNIIKFSINLIFHSQNYQGQDSRERDFVFV